MFDPGLLTNVFIKRLHLIHLREPPRQPQWTYPGNFSVVQIVIRFYKLVCLNETTDYRNDFIFSVFYKKFLKTKTSAPKFIYFFHYLHKCIELNALVEDWCTASKALSLLVVFIEILHPDVQYLYTFIALLFEFCETKKELIDGLLMSTEW